MRNAILVLNAGSSSIKFSLFIVRGQLLTVEVRGKIEGLYTTARFSAKTAGGKVVAENDWPKGFTLGHAAALDHLNAYLASETANDRLLGIGHRVVHGGLRHTGPVRVDARVVADLETFVPLAPLHQPHNLTPIRRTLKLTPEMPQVACFDTAFHRTQPEVAQMFALPADLHHAGILRYGFHGLSYEHIAAVLPELDPAAASARTIALHLGNGASMCAMADGRSVASTMGFTALEGLPMGTRSGSLDPGVVLYLMDQRGMTPQEIETLLYKQSGLLGVSGISNDMRTLLASEDPRAKLAVAHFCYRIRCELGSLAAAMGGVDALVFTGGIGENAARIRSQVCRDAAWLGVEIDEAANAAATAAANTNTGGPCRISTAASRIRAWVVPANEELMIARHTRRLLA